MLPIRQPQSGQIVLQEHLRLCKELSRITLELRREISRAEGDATLKKELDRVEHLINTSMMQIQGIKTPLSRRLKHFLFLKMPMNMGLAPILTQVAFYFIMPFSRSLLIPQWFHAKAGLHAGTSHIN